jgi:hypothetical protein
MQEIPENGISRLSVSGFHSLRLRSPPRLPFTLRLANTLKIIGRQLGARSVVDRWRLGRLVRLSDTCTSISIALTGERCLELLGSFPAFPAFELALCWLNRIVTDGEIESSQGERNAKLLATLNR